MSWKNIQQYSDVRQVKEIPSEEVRIRVNSIINSNPIINKTIQITDGNSRQPAKKMSKLKDDIKKQIQMLYLHEVSPQGKRNWTEFENKVSKMVTDFLIGENYRFYLKCASADNDYPIEKGKIWFLPTYFCLRVGESGKWDTMEIFSNGDRNYPHQEFYCETTSNRRHPCLTIKVEPENKIFEVLLCSNSPYFGRNDPIILKKSGIDHQQYIALDWKVVASRKMLDIQDTTTRRFSIDPDELARIEAKIMLRN